MKIVVNTLTPEAIADREYTEALELEIDGKTELSFIDGESEDNSLSRNFNDIFRIPKLLQRVYDAGVRREKFELVENKVDEI